MNTAVAFIIFRRPDTTARVFERIRQARPPRLYIIADGLRPDKLGEAEAVDAARAVVADNQIDWDCQVTRIYSKVNLGCRERIVSGLDVVFAREEEAIILEDDTLPHCEFFDYCSSLLDRFRNTKKVGHIGGNNFLSSRLHFEHSYRFSRQSHIWGWATWRRCWLFFRSKSTDWTPELLDCGRRSFCSDQEFSYWRQLIERKSFSQSWDYPWHFFQRSNELLSVYPRVNLVENIGFGERATHTTQRLRQNPIRSIMPLVHTKNLIVDESFEVKAFHDHFIRPFLPSLTSRFRVRAGSFKKRITSLLKGPF